MDCVNVLPYLKFVASSVREIIAIGVLGGGYKPQSWGKRRVSDGTIQMSIGEFL